MSGLRKQYFRIVVWICLLLSFESTCQQIAFRHLDISEGLGSNIVTDISMDHLGFMYVATAHGLYRYDGYQPVWLQDHLKTEFNKAQIKKILASQSRKIYALSAKGDFFAGITGQDFKLIETNIQSSLSSTLFLKELETGKLTFITSDTCFTWEESSLSMKIDTQLTSVINSRTVIDLFQIDDTILLSFDDGEVIHFNVREKLVVGKYSQPKLSSSTKVGPYIILANESGHLNFYVSGSTSIQRTISIKRKVEDEISANPITSIRPLDEDQLLIGTEDDGLHIYSISKDSTWSYHQNSATDQSINREQIYRIHTLPNGIVALSHYVGGITYFHSNLYQVEKVLQFYNSENEVYKAYVNDIVCDRDKVVWLAAADRVIEYDPGTGFSKFHYFSEYLSDLNSDPTLLGIRSICLDKNGVLWVGSFKGGLIRFDPKTGARKIFSNNVKQKGTIKIPGTHIWDIIQASNGKIWVAHNRGFLSIDPITFVVDTLRDRTSLAELPVTRGRSVYEDKHGNMWLGSQSKGLFKYDSSNNKLTNYTRKTGLATNNINQVCQHDNGDIFAIHGRGLSVLKSGSDTFLKIDSILQLRSNYIEAMEIDPTGRIWLSNHTTLVQLNPASYELTYYEDKLGIGNMSFISNASTSFSNEAEEVKLFFGSELGFISFEPDSLTSANSSSNAFIFQVRSDDKYYQIQSDTTLSIAHPVQTLSFTYNGINLFGARNLYYRTKLNGFEATSSSITGFTTAEYVGLDPGWYSFQVEVSEDGIHWTTARNVVKVHVFRPFHKSIWFYGALLMTIFGFTGIYILRMLRQRRKEQKIHHQLAELEVKAIRAQMNPHFVFNALNSIQFFTYSGEVDKANEYLSDFARLMRLVLQQSRDGLISLSNEVDLLRLYIKIEGLKFGNEFSYSVLHDATIMDPEHIQIPSMVIQPFVENAIKHGLMPKTGSKVLSVRFRQEDEAIICEVWDNGIGMEGSRKLKAEKGVELPHESMALELVRKRLDLYQSSDERKGAIHIDENPTAGGTLVSVYIPI